MKALKNTKNYNTLVGKEVTIIATFSHVVSLMPRDNNAYFGRTGVIKQAFKNGADIILDGDNNRVGFYENNEFVLNEDQLNRPVIMNPDIIRKRN